MTELSRPLDVDEFFPIQDQELHGRPLEEYRVAGGVAHFRGEKSQAVVCGGGVGISVRKWKHVNCLACFRVRAGVRKSLDKSRGFEPRKGA